jgi:hypothetical protein
MQLPGDTLVADPAIQTTEAVYIDAPSSAVWPWLLQMGQERGGFYGGDGLKTWSAFALRTPTEFTEKLMAASRLRRVGGD